MTDVIDALRTVHQTTSPPAPFDLDESIRRGKVRLRRRRVMQSGMGLAVTTAAVSAAILLPGSSTQGPPEPVGEAMFSSFDEPQQSADELPPSVLQQAGVVESSTRLVGEYEGLAYWLAKNADGDRCLVTAEDGTWLGTACGGVTGWLVSGLNTTSHGFTSAHVFPDDMELGIAEHAGLLFLSENLAISTLSERARGELSGVLEDAAEYYAVFAEPQRRADRLPDLANDQRNVWFPDAAARYLGEYRGMEYWIGARISDYQERLNVCVVQVTTPGEWHNTTCPGADPGELEKPIGKFDEIAGIWLMVVPDAYELTEAESETWVTVGPNLYHATAGP